MILREEDVGGRERVTTDEERVARGREVGRRMVVARSNCSRIVVS